MTDIASELRHDGALDQEQPDAIEQAVIDARATLALNPPAKPCPECDAGLVVDTLRYRQPPPGDAVFENRYRPDPGSTLREVRVVRPCIRCGGTGGR